MFQWYKWSYLDKYEKTLKMLKYENVKFVDNLFPPGMASLCYSKSKMA